MIIEIEFYYVYSLFLFSYFEFFFFFICLFKLTKGHLDKEKKFILTYRLTSHYNLPLFLHLNSLKKKKEISFKNHWKSLR